MTFQKQKQEVDQHSDHVTCEHVNISTSILIFQDLPRSFSVFFGVGSPVPKIIEALGISWPMLWPRRCRWGVDRYIQAFYGTNPCEIQICSEIQVCYKGVYQVIRMEFLKKRGHQVALISCCKKCQETMQDRGQRAPGGSCKELEINPTWLCLEAFVSEPGVQNWVTKVLQILTSTDCFRVQGKATRHLKTEK